MAASVPVWAQDAGTQPLRGSIAPQDAADGVGQGAAPTTPVLGAQTTQATRIAPRPPAGGPQGLPLGGLGDEPPGTRPAHPLGGMGDEPPTNPREGPEEPVAPEESFEEEEGLTLPVTEEILPRQIHSALNPEPHDLDPYLPIGIKIGSFLLFPEADVGTVLTNNVLDTLTDTHGDVAAEVVPKMRLESNWARHSFTAEVNADQIWYRNYPIENESNYQGVLRGRIDVTARTHLRGEAEISQTQQGPSSINLTDISGTQNTTLQEQHATASADHTFNRLTLKLTGTLADYNYDDATNTTLAGPVPFVDIRDYTEAVGTLRSTYEFQSAWAVFVETSMNERDYKEPLNAAGFQRGSSGYTVQGGVNLRLAGSLFGEISAGYGHQGSFSADLRPLAQWRPLLDAVTADQARIPRSVGDRRDDARRFARRHRSFLRIVAAARLLALSRARHLRLLRGCRFCRRSRDRPAHQGRRHGGVLFQPSLFGLWGLRTHGVHEHARFDEQLRGGRGAARAKAQKVRMERGRGDQTSFLIWAAKAGPRSGRSSA
jgi:hypothetical protein